jgi:tRNA-2-methylthio-N6-dimethylallyladenosine synthase
MQNTVYIETMGCQMNKLDSELIVNQLHQLGYHTTDDPDQAGVIIYNTCSVRQHAEEKVISKIGQFRRRSNEQSNLILAVIGCMAQRLGQQLLDDHQQVDIVCGPGQLHQLGALLQQAQAERQQQLALNEKIPDPQLEQLDTHHTTADTKTPFMAYVRIMRGCNKYCSYCIVPYVRGHEQSRPLDHIVEEARRLVDNGVREITLLGQTVNSYKYQNGARTFGLADVLEKIHAIADLQRLRFVTSYPTDFNDNIFQTMASLPKVCEYLHIPAQSGSDRILKAMNRRYTSRQYLDLIERARELVPDITFAGDFIVGFPGETEQDFADSCSLMEKVRYKNCFIFKYSPRPRTRADKALPDDIPDPVKRHRNHTLLELQNSISLHDNQRFIGSTVEILVEGPSKKPHLNKKGSGAFFDSSPANDSSLQLIGRTPGDHIVVFNGASDLIGSIIPVKITKASALTLFAIQQE